MTEVDFVAVADVFDARRETPPANALRQNASSATKTTSVRERVSLISFPKLRLPLT